MKKGINIFILLACLFLLLACNDNVYVRFNISSVKTVRLKNGESLFKPENPVRDGYVFKEWYHDEKLTQKVDFPYIPEQSCTLYGSWEKLFTINFIDFLVDGQSSIVVEENTLYEGPKTPSNTDEEFFNGWFVRNPYEKITFPLVVKKDYDIHESWTNYSDKYDGEETYNCARTKDGNYKIISYNFRVHDFYYSTLYINPKHNGKEVVGIGEEVFRMCFAQGVVIPDTVKYIEKRAFSGMSQCTNLQLGNGLETIGDYAFQGASRLREIIIPNSVKTIGTGAFQNGLGYPTNYYDLIIGNNVESIGTRAFKGHIKLREVVIPDSVKEIGDEAFLGWDITGSSLVLEPLDAPALKSVDFGQGLEAIGVQAFDNCPRIKSIIIPDSVMIIKEKAFYSCELEDVIIGKGVVFIGSKAFGKSLKNTKVYYNGNQSEWDNVIKDDFDFKDVNIIFLSK